MNHLPLMDVTSNTCIDGDTGDVWLRTVFIEGDLLVWLASFGASDDAGFVNQLKAPIDRRLVSNLHNDMWWCMSNGKTPIANVWAKVQDDEPYGYKFHGC